MVCQGCPDNNVHTQEYTMISKFKSMFGSRRFWIGVSGLVVVCADSFFGEGTVNPDTVQAVVLLCAAWIVGDSLRVTE